MLDYEDYEHAENCLQTYWAYRKISKNPNEFSNFQKENAFKQYVRSIEKNAYFFRTSDIYNFVSWHQLVYSSSVSFVYVFLDQEKDIKICEGKYTPLYIGKTKNLKQRLSQHREKDWFKYANQIAIEAHYDDYEAGNREQELIKKLKPLFNKMGGLAMSFEKEKTELDIQVPKMNDIESLDITPIKYSYNKYMQLGARTKQYLNEAILDASEVRDVLLED
jgi:predicted GIY-YIG superfamily endonuclease|tara:strand:+ start:51 stop:710 length:660 start_codon:yes stop_codon:yes gene_type:complete